MPNNFEQLDVQMEQHAPLFLRRKWLLPMSKEQQTNQSLKTKLLKKRKATQNILYQNWFTN